ncbi:aldo/keto reductase [Capnocytophaga ochracea]|uniref:Putative oxidoreductase n=1 Tax=Capnocytophaga ochracea TaxID=1018 RepID=A0A2X2SSB0_CAPOC|nr:aldo/keto reductase [Capnocytophaga ochracea]SQA94764.1 putative oxidoreductase [Capnocytophaga ochracea]
MNVKNYPKIAFGTWSWGAGMYGGDAVFGNAVTEEQLVPVFDEAMKNGFNLWDTATAYGGGASETILGNLARRYPREKVLISTKFTPQLVGNRNPENAVAELFADNLNFLGVETIDLYWIHNPMDVERWTPQLIPLLKSGKVKAVGVSNHNLEQIKRANEILAKEGFRITAVQNHFSLLYRSSEQAGILDYCKANDILFFAYMVLEQGALSGRYSAKNPLPEGSARAQTYNPILPKLDVLIGKMKEIGACHNASVAQVAMAYAIAKGTLPLIGATKPHHITDAIGATKINLSAEEINLLENTAKATGVDTKGGWENNMEAN